MNNYAVTSGDMAEALKRCGSVAKSSGVSMNHVLSYAMGINESVQDASKVGNGLKTIITRLNGVTYSLKTGNVEANRTAKAIKDVGGINMFDEQTGQAKDMNEILGELAGKWDTYSKNQKNALAEGIAGTTQINLFNSLMNNWKQVAKYQSVIYAPYVEKSA